MNPMIKNATVVMSLFTASFGCRPSSNRTESVQDQHSATIATEENIGIAEGISLPPVQNSKVSAISPDNDSQPIAFESMPHPDGLWTEYVPVLETDVLGEDGILYTPPGGDRWVRDSNGCWRVASFELDENGEWKQIPFEQ